jgi:hypothetical protein
MPPVPVVVGLANPFSVGRELTEIVKVAQPAAGAGFTYTAKGKYWDRIASASLKLVTDANAANRRVTVSFQDQDSRSFGQYAAPFVQTAAHTVQYSFAPHVLQAGADDAATIAFPIPSIFLQSGWKVVVSIAGVQVTDQVSLVSLLLERFPTGPEGYRQGAYVVDESPDLIAESV